MRCKNHEGSRLPVSPHRNHCGSTGSTDGPADPYGIHRFLGLHLHRYHRNVDAAFSFRAVFDTAIDQSKQRVILAYSHVGPRMPLRAALPHDDISGEAGLAAEFLHAEALA